MRYEDVARRRSLFRDYGVRRLPTAVLLNGDGSPVCGSLMGRQLIALDPFPCSAKEAKRRAGCASFRGTWAERSRSPGRCRRRSSAPATGRRCQGAPSKAPTPSSPCASARAGRNRADNSSRRCAACASVRRRSSEAEARAESAAVGEPPRGAVQRGGRGRGRWGGRRRCAGRRRDARGGRAAAGCRRGRATAALGRALRVAGPDREGVP